jgi:ABC-type antimicrobial peptide transport system permease subunit
VRELDDRQPVTRVVPYGAVVGSSFGTRRFAAGLLVAFGALALLLAALSVYGALGVLVRQRQREIGIRLALGATAEDIGRLVLRQGLVPVGVGLAGGLLLATAGAQLLSSLLFSVQAVDPASFAAAGALLLLCSLLAAAPPAWRASTLKPASTLRA